MRGVATRRSFLRSIDFVLRNLIRIVSLKNTPQLFLVWCSSDATKMHNTDLEEDYSAQRSVTTSFN